VTFSFKNGKAQFKAATSSRVRYPVSNKRHADASIVFASARPLPSTCGSSGPRPQGSLVAPLMDIWQQRCNAQHMEGSNSDTAAPVGRAMREDHSWRSDLQSPSVAEAHRRMKFHFRKSCRSLDTKSLEWWRQRECAMNGSLSSRTWGDLQKQASTQETYNGNVAQVRGCQRKQLLRIYTGESETTSFPTLSPISTSNVANASVDGHTRLSRGHDSASSVEQGVSYPCCYLSLQQNLLTTPRFGMPVGDVNEVQEGFFPAERLVIDCS